MLIDFGYHFKMPDGLKERSYIYLALIEAELSELAHQYLDANLVNLDAKNNHGESVLNYFTEKKQWSEVRYLIDKGAPYSVGSHVKANKIPLFSAWIHEVKMLHDLYKEPHCKQLLSMTFEEGDLLATATYYSAMPIIEYALVHGFESQLRHHPTLYLYRAKSIEAAKRLLQSLPPSYLNPQFQSITTMPYTLASIINVKDITLSPDTSKKEVPSLLGLTKTNMDAAVAKLGMLKLVKIELDENTVYYSTDDALTKKLCLYFAPTYIEKCYQDIQSIIFQSMKPCVPDVAYCINQLTRLFNILNERHESQNENSMQHDFLDYCLSHANFDASLHQNQLELLQQDGPLLGLKVSYDVNGVAINYTWINDIELMGMESFIKSKENHLEDYRAQSSRLWICISSLDALKAIFEDTLQCIFDKTNPTDDTSMNRIFLRSYNNFRNKISPQKAFISLDANRFFKLPKVIITIMSEWILQNK